MSHPSAPQRSSYSPGPPSAPSFEADLWSDRARLKPELLDAAEALREIAVKHGGIEPVEAPISDEALDALMLRLGMLTDHEV